MGDALAKPWAVVGAGQLGTALAVAAETEGIGLRASWNRSEAGAERVAGRFPSLETRRGGLDEAFDAGDFDGAVVWLTVVDDAVAEVAETLADRLDGADLVVHACGSLDSRVLREAGIRAPVGSLHPLLAVTDPETAAERFGECVWTVEGDEAASAFAEAWTRRIGARLLRVDPGRRALYHASAATAANLVVVLVDAALEMAEAAGIGRDDARSMLVPLLASAVDNLTEQTTADALSGPAARGDDGTIERHREALAEADPRLAEIYEVLTERAQKLGEHKENAE